MSDKALDHFGRVLMDQVRDQTIAEWTMILDGRMKGERAGKIRAALRKSPDPAGAAFAKVIPDVVDSVLHNLLWMLEQNDEFSLAVHVNGGSTNDLKRASDGLAGELYSPDGWIARFSRATPH